MIVALWKHRSLILARAKQELVTRYAGSSMGIIWNVLQPLLQILLFTFIFSQIMLAKVPGLNSKSAFALYLCAGLLPWTAFSEGIHRATNTFLENASYLKKLPTPEIVFVAQTLMASYLAGLISLALLFVVNLGLGGSASWTWLVIPLIFSLQMLFAFGLSLILGTLNVFFRDIGQFLVVLLQIWMWVTPIVYVKEILPAQYLHLITLNPLYWYIQAFQSAIVYAAWPTSAAWGWMLGITITSVLIGFFVLGRLKVEIRDVL